MNPKSYLFRSILSDFYLDCFSKSVFLLKLFYKTPFFPGHFGLCGSITLYYFARPYTCGMSKFVLQK